MRTLMFSGAAAIAMIAAPAFAQSTSNPSNTMPSTTGSTMQTTDQADTMEDMDGEAYSMSTSQQGMYDTWPADRQTAYDNLDMASQEYYWTLTPVQTRAWWVLTSDQQSRIMQMTPEQRTAAWTSIAAQMNGNTSATGSQGMANGSASTSGMTSSSTRGSMNNSSTNGMANSSTTGSMTSNMAGSSTAGTMASGNMRFVRSEVVQATPGDQGPPTGDLPICESNAQDNCINAWEAGERGRGVTRPLDNFPADRMADD